MLDNVDPNPVILDGIGYFYVSEILCSTTAQEAQRVGISFTTAEVSIMNHRKVAYVKKVKSLLSWALQTVWKSVIFKKHPGL